MSMDTHEDWLPDDLPTVEDVGAPEAQTEVERLAGLSPTEYECERKAAAKRLGWRAAVLDQEVSKARPDGGLAGGAAAIDTDDSVVEDLKQWSDPVDGPSLAHDIRAELQRYVVFKIPEQADAATLWIIGTYFMDVWALWPKVLVSSPEKRCGKTVLVEAIEAHVHRAFLVSNISAAGLFRVIETYAPTVLIDEADRFLRRNEEANGIINAGHRRRTAKVVRVEERGGEHVVRKFSVWGAQVIAGIGTQEETLVDRSVRLALRRRLQSETVDKLPARYFEDRLRTRRQLARWAEDNRVRISAMDDEAPSCGNDRAQDNWTPLFRIAIALGDDWPARCASAYDAIEKAGDDEDRETLGARLLRDMATILSTFTGRMGSSALRDHLLQIEDAPWGEFPPRGLPITPQRIAAILKDYDVRPRQDKLGSYYDPEDIHTALERYGPQTPEHPATDCHTATGTAATTEKEHENNAQWRNGRVADGGGSPDARCSGGSSDSHVTTCDDPFDPDAWV